MTIGGYIMYKPTKRAWIVGLSAGLIIAGAGANINAQAGQSYDSSNVGISNRVGEYIKSGKESDPVAKLTNGLASVSDTAIIPIQDYLNLGSEASIKTLFYRYKQFLSY